MTNANATQEGGKHYKGKSVQHWDFVLMHNMPYMEAQVFKYVLRWKQKNGLQDLRKARHFLDKLIEYELEAQKPVVDVCSGTLPDLGPILHTKEPADRELPPGLPIQPPPEALKALDPDLRRQEEFKVGSGKVVLEGDDLTRARQVLDDKAGAYDNNYLNPDSGEPQGKGYVDQD